MQMKMHLITHQKFVRQVWIFSQYSHKLMTKLQVQLCPDYLKHALLAICMGEDLGHYAGCAIHSYQTCVRLERAYMQIASDASTWAMLSGVRTEDGRPSGFLHVTELSSRHCLTH